MTAAVPEVLRSFGLEDCPYDQVGSRVWRVESRGGPLALRALARSGRKAAVSIAALELLIEAGAGCLPRWHRTPQGALEARHDHDTWLLSDWVDGHGATLGLSSDAAATARGLAVLHGYSAGLLLWSEDDRDPFRRFAGRCRSRAKALRTYVLIAENRLRPTATDRVFLSLVPEALVQAEEVLAKLDGPDLCDYSARSHAAGAFGYRRIGEGGVIITAQPEPRAMFVDWSACRRDLPVLDLAKLLNRVVRGSGGDEATFAVTLAAYHAARPLVEPEVRLLEAAIRFPDEFYGVAQRYYENKRDWTERSFARRMRRAMDRVYANQGCAERIPELTGGCRPA
jgi:CotS family spore coat protein